MSFDLGPIREALDGGSRQQLTAVLGELHPAQIADMLESLPPRERAQLWAEVDEAVSGDVLAELNDEVRANLLEAMDVAEVVAAARGMETDDLADVVADLSTDIAPQVIDALPDDAQERLQSVLAFPEDCAGGLMDPDTISVRQDERLADVQDALRRDGRLPDKTDAIFVVDRNGVYLGVLYVARLIVRDPQSRVRDVMDTSVEAFTSDCATDKVSKDFRDRDLVTAPVTDASGRLIGQITVDDVVDLIQEQAEHDILSMAGLDEEDDMFAPVVTSAQRRAIWLGVNLATAFLAAGVVAFFKPTLDKVVILAVLMPVVASMGGIAGSQTLTLMIRGLAMGRVQNSNARWLLIKELAVGSLNGIAWALIVAAVTAFLFSTWKVGLVIGAAITINLFAAALAGFAIPLILKKLRIDPALAGSVILTTVTDVVGFVAFLGLGTLFLL